MKALALVLLCILPCFADDRYLDLPVDPNQPPPTPPKMIWLEPPPPIVPPIPLPPIELPPSIYGKDLVTKSDSLVYVIDVSGSMIIESGPFNSPGGTVATGTRLDHAKAELIKSITTLPLSFQFNIIAYDCSVYPWSNALLNATPDAKAAAYAWVANLQPLGATGTGPAVEYALLSWPKNSLIVLLTDGDPNCGAGDPWDPDGGRAAHLSRIRFANIQHARIDVFGISATGLFKQFCLDIAAQNGGSYTDVF